MIDIIPDEADSSLNDGSEMNTAKNTSYERAPADLTTYQFYPDVNNAALVGETGWRVRKTLWF
ncbi:hypothetical protein ABDK75_14010 [Gluconobacter sp. OJA]|uniref:hypothetical protein n=1 Tax=Gluconobacter sp. OJA TaxID=3145197 RepID=UPI0031F80AD7